MLTTQLDAAPTGPVFLASYPTERTGALNSAAFLYDNAVATIALVGCGVPAKARRIGDAILIALDHDRYWHDGRLRNAYAAGGADTPVKLAGWWDNAQNRWVEDLYQVGSDNGNMAWAMLALETLDRATGDARYRKGAARIGTWIKRWRDGRGAGGFTGGTFAHEPAPQALIWKSTEHNVDLAAAFYGLALVTGDARWRLPGQAAERFVDAMWLPACRCFAAGTGEDGVTPNTLLALDAQVLPLMALPGASVKFAAAVTTLEKRLGNPYGYAFADTGGVWTEGTAQAALLMDLLGRDGRADALMRKLDALRAPGGGYYAAGADGAATGLPLEADAASERRYFHIPHLAALAWAALADRRFNPFTATRALPD